MKRLLLTVVFVILVTLGTVVLSQAAVSPVLTVNVPFSFTVGKSLLPAGQYTVQIDRVNSASALGSLLTFRSQDGRLVTKIVALPESHRNLRTGASLIFHKYVDSYFLAKVESYGLECALARTPAEKEVASRPSHGGGTVAVAAE